MTDLTPHVDEVYPLYLQVHERSPLKFERLTKAYLCSLGQRMPERARFFVWRQNGKAIAFSVALVHDGTIYDDYLGLDYRIASTSISISLRCATSSAGHSRKASSDIGVAP